MSTLYIDRKNLSLSVEHDALIFREGDKRINTVPLNVLERICIKGETRLGTSVLAKLGEKGIGLLVLSGRMQKPISYFLVSKKTAAVASPNTRLSAHPNTA